MIVECWTKIGVRHQSDTILDEYEMILFVEMNAAHGLKHDRYNFTEHRTRAANSAGWKVRF